MEKNTKILSLIFQLPLFVYFLISIFFIIIGESIKFYIFIPTLFLLFLNGYGLSKNTKKWNLISFISIFIFTIWYSINGYFDFVKWTSTKIAIILLIFYIVVFAFKLYLNKKESLS